MRFEAVEPDDVYDAEDGRRVVLLDQDVIVISPLAAEFLDAVESGLTDPGAVADRLIEAFGAPPGEGESLRLTEQVAADLAARGLLEIFSAS